MVLKVACSFECDEGGCQSGYQLCLVYSSSFSWWHEIALGKAKLAQGVQTTWG